MGSDCSHCSNCESGLSEKENELNRHSIEYPKGSIKKEDNQKLTSDSKNKITEFYRKYIPTIIFLQLKIKKFLNRIK